MKKLFLLSALLLVATLIIPVQSASQVINEGTFKIARTFGLIESFYVDTVNMNTLTEKAIVEILKNLDPHSTYISADDVKDMNEPLTGNFDGIGVQFNLLHDTIIIIEPLSGGPSDKVGIKAGDRILTINAEKVAGMKLTSAAVRKRLMGPKGSKVNVTVFRKGSMSPMEFTIVRDKIPIYSLDASYMLDNQTGYIKLNKFAATTEKEFMQAVDSLKKQNMQNLVLDLRGNGGGYMLAATAIAEKFFDKQQLLVFLQGRKTPRQDYKSAGQGPLASTKVVVLTDENSASASEILAGALQDWDRGVVIGRRTFGKGLVQNGFYLTDGSMIRLTIARYYTPTGRSIQRAYSEGFDKYVESFVQRYDHGEMLNADSIKMPDSLKYTTLINKRVVYGGGGIMPDIFVSIDTSYSTPYFNRLVAKNILNSFTLEYYDKNRTALTSKYKTFERFQSDFNVDEDMIKAFIQKGESEGVKFNEAQFNKSKEELSLVLKGLVAINIWQTNEYFRVINQNDKVIAEALRVIEDRKTYNATLGYR
ncbi:MAG TPA: S41 family peptidase [Bacteroidales bacterium]|nr:S41 family peptidase [Bacteroidales bacterium]